MLPRPRRQRPHADRVRHGRRQQHLVRPARRQVDRRPLRQRALQPLLHAEPAALGLRQPQPQQGAVHGAQSARGRSEHPVLRWQRALRPGQHSNRDLASDIDARPRRNSDGLLRGKAHPFSISSRRSCWTISILAMPLVSRITAPLMASRAFVLPFL
jgi:hypothetical protein